MSALYSFYVPELHCSSCVKRLKAALASAISPEHVDCDPLKHRVNIQMPAESEPHENTLNKLQKQLSAHGFHAYPLQQQTELVRQQGRQFLKRLFVAGLGMMQNGIFAITVYLQNDMPLHWIETFHWFSLMLTTPVLLYAGKPFFLSALQGLLNKCLTMEAPISLALVIAYIYSCWGLMTGIDTLYFDSITMFLFFITLGRFIEWRTRYHAGQATDALWQGLPKTAYRISDGMTLPIDELKVDDQILIKSGETLPVDGPLIEGHTLMDESLLTGEATPQEKQVGDTVFAGTLNCLNPITVTVTHRVESSVVATLQRRLLEAQATKPKLALMADRIASVFITALLLVSLVVAGIWWWLDPSQIVPIVVSVLIVTCPCALSLATPTALSAAMGYLSKKGILVTQGDALENQHKITDIFFDKTGTLTQGAFRLQSTRGLGKTSEKDCLQLACALERSSEHPLALAFTPVDQQEFQANKIENHIGIGVSGTIDGQRYWLGAPERLRVLLPNLPCDMSDATTTEYETPIVLTSDTELLAYFLIADPIKPEAQKVIDTLNSNYTTTLISGDHPSPTKAVAKKLGINHVQSRCLPEEKLDHIQTQQAQNKVVMMVGDGLNDGPILAQANIGVAMGSGTTLAQSTADVILINNSLTGLTTLFKIGQNTRAIIRQNMTWALLYNAIAIPFAAAGWVPAWLAAIGMSVSSLVVVLNSSRLLKQS